jgi:hypothetical protein
VEELRKGRVQEQEQEQVQSRKVEVICHLPFFSCYLTEFRAEKMTTEINGKLITVK